jgi:hypothetical protein
MGIVVEAIGLVLHEYCIAKDWPAHPKLQSVEPRELFKQRPFFRD